MGSIRTVRTLAIAVVVGTTLLPVAGGAAGQTRLNVLFIAVDDLRPELGCYGHAISKSPHIDKLAASGVLFTRAYCQEAICAPSRMSLLSGCRPDTVGVYGLSTPLRTAMPNVLTLPEHFKNNGYRTVSLGKIYHHGSDDKQGWSARPRAGRSLYFSEEVRAWRRQRTAEARKKGLTGSRAYNYAVGPATECLDIPDNAYGDGSITDEAIRQLRTHREKPLFLAVGYWKPHLPFNAPKKYWDLYDRGQIKLPNTMPPKGTPKIAFTNWGELRAYRDIPKKGDLGEAMTRKLIHGYYACVSYVDTQIGRLLRELDQLGLRRKTVIVLWGDHGWKLGEYGDWCKHTNFELDTHVPMLLSAPGKGTGTICSALTEFVDIYPTLVELCGLKIPPHCEGTSMVPLLENPNRSWKAAAFSQYPRGPIMGYSLRTARWRYTEWVSTKTKAVIDRELYDHAAGAFAHENVVTKPEHAAILNHLRGLMRRGWRDARPKKAQDEARE